MKYNLSNPLQARQATERMAYLVERGARVELVVKRKARSLPQNNYLHLIISAWGQELGYDPTEMKYVIKSRLLPHIFEYKKRGVTLYRSTASLTDMEATEVIDKIRSTAMESTGFYIPAPNEFDLVDAMGNDLPR